MKIALGSATELHYQLLLARDLNYLQPVHAEEMMQETTEIRAMLSSLSKRLKSPQ